MSPHRATALSVEDAVEWLNSLKVQLLACERADRITLVGERWYTGKAWIDEEGCQRVALNLAAHRSPAELTVTLCHELAHFEAEELRLHDDSWRLAFAELISEAGRLGLLTDDEVEAGLDAALNGPRGAGLDWRERIAERERNKARRDQSALQPLLDAGLKVGSQVRFTFRGEPVVAEVIRINRRTISALRPDGRMRYRLSFSRVEEVLPPEREA